MKVIVYSTPNCQPCRATCKALDAAGVEYEKVDISQDEEARKKCLDMGFQSLPVVVTFNEQWSGYRPDLIKSLTA